MKRLFALATLSALAGLFSLVPRQAAAQTPMKGMDRFTLSVYGGGFSPVGDLGPGEFEGSGTVGGTAGVWVGRYVGARVNILFARTDIQGIPQSEIPFDDPDIWMYNGDILLRLPMMTDRGWFSPYLLAGAGGKYYDFQQLAGESQVAGNIGAGLEYRFPGQHRWGVNLEVRDFISDFSRSTFEDIQHDLVWTGGLTVNF